MISKLLIARLRKIRRRTVALMAIWLIMLLITLVLLSSLEGFFNSSPEGRTIASLSWAGYIISQNFNAHRQITAISASWVVPKVNVSAGRGYSSAWIGVGGQSDKTLIQVGTEHDSSGEQDSYYAWYEMLPAYLIKINDIEITPGDSVSASLSLVDSEAGEWSIQFSDNSNGQTFSLDVNYQSLLSSGEWIVERPSISGQISTLSDFGAVTFSNCQIYLGNESGSISNFSYIDIEMTNQATRTLAFASPLSQDGQSFNVTYSAS